jgi:hypothetical protein
MDKNGHPVKNTCHADVIGMFMSTTGMVVLAPLSFIGGETAGFHR